HLAILTTTALGLTACQPTVEQTEPATVIEEPSVSDERLEIAEGMIDAFYSYNPAELQPFLSSAGDTEERLLWYQGWAEGGNYKIVKREPCAANEAQQIICPITVEDDPVLALKIDFKVTDTFTITFEDTTITKVATSSNDKPIYYQAGAWVRENLPEVMEGPCQGFFAGGPTPGDCARAMTDGYAQFAASDDFPN
ncbi:MAG: hypothetical protein AAFV59_07865, partial [Pseudomonadota bacterium]